jgi:hypothetical protein
MWCFLLYLSVTTRYVDEMNEGMSNAVKNSGLIPQNLPYSRGQESRQREFMNIQKPDMIPFWILRLFYWPGLEWCPCNNTTLQSHQL